MSRDITITAREAAFAQETGEAFPVLLTITHEDLTSPIQLANYDVDIFSRSPFTAKDESSNDNTGVITTSTALATNFDGTLDYLNRGADLTGSVDGKKGWVSLWFKRDGNGTVDSRLIQNTTNRFLIQLRSSTSGSVLKITAANTSGIEILSLQTVAAFTPPSGWHHLLASWDLAVPDSARLYIDDSSDLVETTYVDDVIDYTQTDWGIAADQDGANKLAGCLSEIAFSMTEYIDFGQLANRRKFITADFKRVSLGVDGSKPTGNSPIIFLHSDDTTFEVNSGTGGDFTRNGTPSTCVDAPLSVISNLWVAGKLGPTQLRFSDSGDNLNIPDIYEAGVKGTNFDGVTDYLTRSSDFVGNVDGKLGLVSFWIKPRTGTSFTSDFMFTGSPGNYLIRGFTGDFVTITLRNSVGSLIMTALSTVPVTIGEWNHILIAWDLAALKVNIYVNDQNADDPSPTVVDDFADYTLTTHSHCALTTGSFKFNGCISESYVNFAETLDITVLSNRRKFVAFDGLKITPEILGSDGSTPTGTAPLIYLPNQFSSYEQNAGTGGDYVVNGTLTACSDSPLIGVSDFTIEFWFTLHNRLDISTVPDFMHTNKGGANRFWQFFLNLSPNEFDINYSHGDGTTNTDMNLFPGTAQVELETPVHIAVTKSGDNFEGFVNGISTVTLTIPNAINSPNLPLEVEFDDPIQGPDFSLDELRIWTAVRTVTEIFNNKDIQLSGDEKDLFGYWRLNDGNRFIAFPFRLNLPSDADDQPPRAQLAVDNVDRSIVKAIRSISSAPSVLLEVVRAADPDTVEASFPDFTLTDINYNEIEVTGDLTLESFLREPYPSGRFNPGSFPGMFVNT